MDQPPPEESTIFTLVDPATDTSETYTLLIIRTNSDGGRAYAKLPNHEGRLEYLGKHHHKESKIAIEQWYFYKDRKAGPQYEIRIDSPEDKEVYSLTYNGKAPMLRW